MRDILIVLRLHYRLEGGIGGGGSPPRKFFKGLQTLLKLGLRKILKHQFFSQDPRSDPRLFQVCFCLMYILPPPQKKREITRRKKHGIPTKNGKKN